MMGRLRLIVLFLIFVAVVWRFGGDGHAPRRPPPLPAPDNSLPTPGADGPVYEIAADTPCPALCTGSAFAIDRQGHWLTAQHVVEGCRQVAVLTGDRRQLPVRQVARNPHADVTLLVTDAAAASLPLNLGALRQGQDGFHIGYPAGAPGQVHSVLLGRARARQQGRGGLEEPVMAWAEISRDPPREGSLGGLSGGAVLDRDGTVIGVTTAESPRRGRVISAAPASLRYLLERSRLVPQADAAGEPVSAESYREAARRLRARGSVALVLCRA